MSKRCGRNSPVKMLPDMNPRGVARIKIDVQTIDFLSKIQNHTKEIVHNGVAKNHTAVMDTEPHQYMIVMAGWEIIKRHGVWKDYQGVNMGGPSDAGRRL